MLLTWRFAENVPVPEDAIYILDGTETGSGDSGLSVALSRVDGNRPLIVYPVNGVCPPDPSGPREFTPVDFKLLSAWADADPRRTVILSATKHPVSGTAAILKQDRWIPFTGMGNLERDKRNPHADIKPGFGQ